MSPVIIHREKGDFQREGLAEFHWATSPLKNRFSSDWRILHPFPALIALILPERMYFKKVGLEIFRYSIASSVVKTTSFSIKDIELPPFVLIFFYLKQNTCREGVGYSWV
jgi:hypothetical protein